MLHVSQGSYDGANGVWNVGELRTGERYQAAGKAEPTLVLGAAAGDTATVSIENTVDYTVCIDSSGNDVDAATESLCKPDAASTNTWHTTPVYDYDAGNTTATITAQEGAGGAGKGAPSLKDNRPGVTVTWDAVDSVNGIPVSHYEVQKLVNPWVTIASKVEGTQYKDIGVSGEGAHLYRVRAVSEAEVAGPWSAPMSASSSGGVITNTITEYVYVEVPEDAFAYFASSKVSRSVAENSAPGSRVGAPVAVVRNSGNNVTYYLRGDDASMFSIEAVTGQILVGQGTALDYESGHTIYRVEVVAAPSRSQIVRAAVAISIMDVPETGTVTISPSGQPEVGRALTATLIHGGGEPVDPRWQWQRSTPEGLWAEIHGANQAHYIPTERDAGRRLRAIVTYGEPGGGDGVAGAVTQALPGEPLKGPVARYDVNGDGRIDMEEATAAIGDYFAGILDFGDVMVVIGTYFAS